MDKTLSYYDILKISPDSTIKEIKSSYRKLVRIFHPDVSDDANCNEIFKQIVKAYSILKDQDLRESYDKELNNKNKILPVLNFKFYNNFKDKSSSLLRSVKIFFKNIYDKPIYDKNKVNDLLKPDINISESLVNMSIYELEERLQYSENKYVKINAALAIGYKNEKRGYPVLEKMLSTSDMELKKAVIWAIGNLQMKKSLKYLKIIFKSSVSGIRLELLKAIIKITSGKSILLYDMFVNLLKDDDENISEEVLNIFLKTNNKLFQSDLKELLKKNNKNTKIIVDKLMEEGRIITV